MLIITSTESDLSFLKNNMILYVTITIIVFIASMADYKKKPFFALKIALIRPLTLGLVIAKQSVEIFDNWKK